MTPWELAKTSEHSEQRALFAWANCVVRSGFAVAADPRGYALASLCEIPENVKLNSTPVPELRLLYAVHNQGHGDKIRGAMARAEGVKKGVPDVVLPVTRRIPILFAGLYIELKRPGKPKKVAKGRTSQVQVDWIDELIKQGHYATVAVGWVEAANIISWYMGASCRVPSLE